MSSFTTPTKPESTSSIFGGNAATKSPFSNFGNVASTAESTVPNTPTTQPSVFATPFASPNVTVTSANTSSGIFGKPDQPFGQQNANSIFGGNAAATTPSTPFGSTPFGATPTSNAFGTPQATTNTFGTPTSNAFGSSTSTTTSNIFGGSAGSVFGSAANAFGSSKSIFGGGGGGSTTEQTSTFGSTGSTSLFGAPNTATVAQTSPFGQTASQSTGSLFGGSSFGNATQPSTASIFGGGSTVASTGFGQSTFGNSSFSQQSSPFGGSGGAFSQPASTGFGSQQPTFGGQATFGAAPTFGSPKSGFGSFANVANTFGTSPTQQNSLFETLGSSDTGLSFGNIAQNSSSNAPKSSFGGGSFSTWR